MIPGLRSLKRFLLLFIALAVVVGVFIVGGKVLREPVPTPTPDPREELEPISVLFTKVFPVRENDYDVLAQVRNPNQSYGSGNVRYALFADGSEIFTDSFYIFPGQTKYVVISPLQTDREITNVSMRILSIDWRELDPLALQGVNFVVTNSSYSSSPQVGVFGRLRGFVANNSDFDVNRVDVAILLMDEEENPVAINRTEIHTFLGHTTRGFEASWFDAFEGSPLRVDIEAHANLFEQSNFIRTYGGQERFQEF